MNRSGDIEIKVGIFVTLGLGLIMLTILLLGGGQSILERSVLYHARFHQIEGLVDGAIVKLAGVKVGQVSTISFVKETGEIEITFSVNSRYKDYIHKDATVGVQTQGMLGDRYLIVFSGSPDQPTALPGAELRADAAKEFKDYLTDADEVLGRLKNSLKHIENVLDSFTRDNRSEVFFKNMTSASTRLNDGSKPLRESLDHFRSILSKIDNGEGTLGSLVNDPALYDDVRSLLGGANRNRVLKYFIRKSVEESRDAAKTPPK